MKGTQGVGGAPTQGEPALLLDIPLVDGVVLFTGDEKMQASGAVSQETGRVVRPAGVVTALHPGSRRPSRFLTHGRAFAGMSVMPGIAPENLGFATDFVQGQVGGLLLNGVIHITNLRVISRRREHG